MSIVQPQTGELVEMSVFDAQDLTRRIKDGLERDWVLIKRAYEKRAWASLGYATWDAYCAKEFGDGMLRLPRETRQEAVVSLRDAGLSTRAIAAATGASDMTVRRDLAGATNVAPAEPSTCAGCGNYQADCVCSTSTGEEISTTVESEPARITGTDGKSYSSAGRDTIHADPNLKYRARVSTEVAKVHQGLLLIDAKKAAQLCPIDTRESHLAFCRSIRSWADAYEAALSTTTLRSVQ